MNLGVNKSESSTERSEEDAVGDFDESFESESAEQGWTIKHPGEVTGAGSGDDDERQPNYAADEEFILEQSDESKQKVCYQLLVYGFK